MPLTLTSTRVCGPATYRPSLVAGAQFAAQLVEFALCRLRLLGLLVDVALQFPLLSGDARHLLLALFHLQLELLQPRTCLVSLHTTTDALIDWSYVA